MDVFSTITQVYILCKICQGPFIARG